MTRKWWKKRMSSGVNRVGLDRSGAEGGGTEDSHEPGGLEEGASCRARGRASGYSHGRPKRTQLAHSGSVSGHFTFLRLQLKQPRRDLVWPFRGIGLRRGLRASCVSEAEADDEGALAGESRPSASMLLLFLLLHLSVDSTCLLAELAVGRTGPVRGQTRLTTSHHKAG